MKISIIGAGNMGGAIARGVMSSDVLENIDLCVANHTTGKLDRLKNEYPEISVTTDNREAVADADMIIFAVKPWILPTVLKEVACELDLSRQMLVSLAGGISLVDFEEMLGPKSAAPALFQVIPNTAVAIGLGMTFIAAAHATDEQIECVSRVFRSMGEVAVVEPRLMGAGTALCSCGIAYVFKFVQACVQGGVQLGFRPADALRYVTATMKGAAAMLENEPLIPQQQIDRVTTPGGMTIKGINELENTGFTSSVIKALLASLK